MTKRLFSNKQKNTLFLISDGKCSNCGVELTSSNYHADHVIPYSKGGKTLFKNGQALCNHCNLTKGNKMLFTPKQQTYKTKLKKSIQLRRFQDEMLELISSKIIELKRKIANGEKIILKDKLITAYVSPAQGKTLGSILCMSELYEEGIIDHVNVFVPRISLCDQFEDDMNNAINNIFEKKIIGKILWKKNKLPLVEKNRRSDLLRQLGYVTTFDSLVSQHRMHVNFAKTHRTCMVVDESQMIGEDGDYDTSTKAYQYLEEISKHAQFVIVMTGTPHRSDNKKIGFMEYKSNKDGIEVPIADVKSTYKDGVSERIVREVEFFNYQGELQVTIENEDGTWKTTKINQITDSERIPYSVLIDEKFYEKMVDKHVENVRKKQKDLNKNFCGLIACTDQNHARKVLDYFKKYHPNHKTVIAISDDNNARKVLSDFKKGGFDTIVTVKMVFMGYSYKPISTVTILTNVRTLTFIEQLIMRGGRYWDEKECGVPYENQILTVIGPDDQKMQEFRDYFLKEKELGIQKRIDDPIREDNEITESYVEHSSVNVTLDRADTNLMVQYGDVNDGSKSISINENEYNKIELLKKKYRSLEPTSKWAAILLDYTNGNLTPDDKMIDLSEHYVGDTETEKAKNLASKIKTKIGKVNYSLENKKINLNENQNNFSYINQIIKNFSGKKSDSGNLDNQITRKNIINEIERFHNVIKQLSIPLIKQAYNELMKDSQLSNANEDSVAVIVDEIINRINEK